MKQLPSYYMRREAPCIREHVGIPDEFVEHGNVARLKQSMGMEPVAISANILNEVYGDKAHTAVNDQ